ncbi:hypothetical protein HU200_043068 [Digitaria exilis]|uniref:Uncharacterized protein n=1 Tax=Digitaria exilis TaxID=1010633 RepID=A0A835B514_9POAL|nr:hypothetical protein HU200_043068 [Digitaria exilis]CAB3471205.1 unnamed protein product [Digitaria exilis]
MATLAVAIVLLAASAASAIDFTEHDLASEQSMWELYERWCEHYKVVRDPGEKARRFIVFKENARLISEFNHGHMSYNKSLNMFGDMTDDETRCAYHCSMVASPPPSVPDETFTRVATRNLPWAVDWRNRAYGGGPASYVTGAKNQGPGCGSCWAFAVTATVESINAIRTKILTPLSEQQLLDCNLDNGGCSGGYVHKAFDYVVQSGGLTFEYAYPYKGRRQGFCPPHLPIAATINGHHHVPSYDMFALMAAVAAQPVVVAVQADEVPFKRYGGGVFRGPCGTRPGHAVTLVGYGTTNDGENYWIVKNSWGPNWGENGFIRMKRDVPEREGLCGILVDSSYPVKY